jgi:hypothetical protein
MLSLSKHDRLSMSEHATTPNPLGLSLSKPRRHMGACFDKLSMSGFVQVQRLPGVVG